MEDYVKDVIEIAAPVITVVSHVEGAAPPDTPPFTSDSIYASLPYAKEVIDITHSLRVANSFALSHMRYGSSNASAPSFRVLCRPLSSPFPPSSPLLRSPADLSAYVPSGLLPSPLLAKAGRIPATVLLVERVQLRGRGGGERGGAGGGGDWGIAEERIGARLSALRSLCRSRGCDVHVLIVDTTPPAAYTSTATATGATGAHGYTSGELQRAANELANERLNSLRRRAGLDGSSVTVLSPAECTLPADGVPSNLVMHLEALLRDRAYAYLAARKRRLKLNIERVAWTMPLQVFLKTRILFKLGYVSELRNKPAKACKYYQMAYSTLLEGLPTASDETLPQLRAVAEVLTLKIVSHYFLYGMQPIPLSLSGKGSGPPGAQAANIHFQLHMRSFEDRCGDPGLAFVHYEWCMQQYVNFGELLLRCQQRYGGEVRPQLLAANFFLSAVLYASRRRKAATSLGLIDEHGQPTSLIQEARRVTSSVAFGAPKFVGAWPAVDLADSGFDSLPDFAAVYPTSSLARMDPIFGIIVADFIIKEVDFDHMSAVSSFLRRAGFEPGKSFSIPALAAPLPSDMPTLVYPEHGLQLSGNVTVGAVAADTTTEQSSIQGRMRMAVWAHFLLIDEMLHHNKHSEALYMLDALTTPLHASKWANLISRFYQRIFKAASHQKNADAVVAAGIRLLDPPFVSNAVSPKLVIENLAKLSHEARLPPRYHVVRGLGAYSGQTFIEASVTFSKPVHRGMDSDLSLLLEIRSHVDLHVTVDELHINFGHFVGDVELTAAHIQGMVASTGTPTSKKQPALLARGSTPTQRAHTTVEASPYDLTIKHRAGKGHDGSPSLHDGSSAGIMKLRAAASALEADLSVGPHGTITLQIDLAPVTVSPTRPQIVVDDAPASLLQEFHARSVGMIRKEEEGKVNHQLAAKTDVIMAALLSGSVHPTEDHDDLGEGDALQTLDARDALLGGRCRRLKMRGTPSVTGADKDSKIPIEYTCTDPLSMRDVIRPLPSDIDDRARLSTSLIVSSRREGTTSDNENIVDLNTGGYCETVLCTSAHATMHLDDSQISVLLVAQDAAVESTLEPCVQHMVKLGTAQSVMEEELIGAISRSTFDRVLLTPGNCEMQCRIVPQERTDADEIKRQFDTEAPIAFINNANQSVVEASPFVIHGIAGAGLPVTVAIRDSGESCSGGVLFLSAVGTEHELNDMLQGDMSELTEVPLDSVDSSVDPGFSRRGRATSHGGHMKAKIIEIYVDADTILMRADGTVGPASKFGSADADNRVRIYPCSGASHIGVHIPRLKAGEPFLAPVTLKSPTLCAVGHGRPLRVVITANVHAAMTSGVEGEDWWNVLAKRPHSYRHIVCHSLALLRPPVTCTVQIIQRQPVQMRRNQTPEHLPTRLVRRLSSRQRHSLNRSGSAGEIVTGASFDAVLNFVVSSIKPVEILSLSIHEDTNTQDSPILCSDEHLLQQLFVDAPTSYADDARPIDAGAGKHVLVVTPGQSFACIAAFRAPTKPGYYRLGRLMVTWKTKDTETCRLESALPLVCVYVPQVSQSVQMPSVMRVDAASELQLTLQNNTSVTQRLAVDMQGVARRESSVAAAFELQSGERSTSIELLPGEKAAIPWQVVPRSKGFQTSPQLVITSQEFSPTAADQVADTVASVDRLLSRGAVHAATPAAPVQQLGTFSTLIFVEDH